MRGKVGDKLTICGDWLYDWAKIMIGLWWNLIIYNYWHQLQRKYNTCFQNIYWQVFRKRFREFKNNYKKFHF